MATVSFVPCSVAWKTTPNDPFPMTRSAVNALFPSRKTLPSILSLLILFLREELRPEDFERPDFLLLLMEVILSGGASLYSLTFREEVGSVFKMREQKV